MKLLILIIGLSLSSNCAGQRRIVKKTIRSSKTHIIVIPKIEPRPISIQNKQQKSNEDVWKNHISVFKPDSTAISSYVKLFLLLDQPQDPPQDPKFKYIPINYTMPSMPKSPFNNNKPDSTAISSHDKLFLLLDQPQDPPQDPKFKYIPIKLIDLTYNLPDVISYNYSSSIFHLIATKNPLYPDYKGFTFTKTISYFSFNNKKFND